MCWLHSVDIILLFSKILTTVQTTSFDLENKTNKRSPPKIPLLQKSFFFWHVAFIEEVDFKVSVLNSAVGF